MFNNQNSYFLNIIHLGIAFLIILAAITVPASYFYMKYSNHSTGLEASLSHNRYQLEQIINHNPDFWKYEIHRIEGFFHDAQVKTHNSHWRIVGKKGEDVFRFPSSAPKLSWPLIKREINIYDSHKAIATIEVASCLHPEAIEALILALLSFSIGVASYIGLRNIPLRALDKMWSQMAFQAEHDNLTGLPNRSLFNDRLIQAQRDIKNTDLELAVMSIDLDHFKDVNDTLGHAYGDLLLKNVAADIQKVIGIDQTLARLGGDEFALIRISADIANDAIKIADSILEKLSKPYQIEDNVVHIGASIGIAITVNCNNTDAEQLIKRSDIALYQAKEEGRNNYHFFQEVMNDKLRERKLIEKELRYAIAENTLQLYYQPQFDLNTNAIVGVEALVRWQHREAGFISPEKFIPIAEMSGLIHPLGQWILKEACRQATKWPELRIAVNVSPIQFRSGNLVSSVKEALDESGLPSHLLELEITEGILLHNTKKTIKILENLKALGVRIAMDDFGTGYSSLSYLRRFPFDKIKIDRSFIADLDQDNGESKAIIRAIINLSEAMGMSVNAEGVEMLEQAQILQKEGCDEVQGYLFGRPMISNDLTEIFRLENQNHPKTTKNYLIAS